MPPGDSSNPPHRSRPARADRAATGAPAALAALLAALVTLAVAVTPPSVARGATDGRVVLDAAAVWDYAEELFRRGEYFRAISEYKRLVYYFPRDERVEAALVRIADAYVRGGEPPRAILHVERLLEQERLSLLRDDALFLRGLGWLERDPDRPYPLREPDIRAALADFGDIRDDWRGHESLQGFLDAMADPPDLPHKSPWLAGTLSAVVPGTGSFYVGRWAEGSLALAFNALFLSATVRAFQTDQVALGTVLGVFALGFYGGNVYAAVNGAHKFNARAQSAYLAGQRQRFGIVVGPGGLGAGYARGF